MKIILLLGRSQGGGTEAHANWLLGALQGAGYETDFTVYFLATGNRAMPSDFLKCLVYRWRKADSSGGLNQSRLI